MKALILKEIGEFLVDDINEPEITGELDVKVEIIVTGICGSDVHYWKEGRIGDFIVQSPIILGHESSGKVVAVGNGVTDVQVGDIVSLEPGVGCGHCSFCISGKYNLCESMKFAATPPYDGTLTKYYILPQHLCHAIPNSMMPEEGALMEPLSVAVHIAKLACISVRDNVVIFGAGPIGLLCAAVAKAYGANKVALVDIQQERLNFGVEYAKVIPICVSRDMTSLQVSEMVLSSIESADVAIEATGARTSIAACVQVLKSGGHYVQAGMGIASVDFPITTMVVKELNVHGSFRYGPEDFKDAIFLVESRKVQVLPLVSHMFEFEEAVDAFELVHSQSNGVIKALIYGPK